MISLPSSSVKLLDQPSHPQRLLENSSTSFPDCYAACQTGNLGQVQSLLNLDPSLITLSDDQGKTLMHIAVEKRTLCDRAMAA